MSFITKLRHSRFNFINKTQVRNIKIIVAFIIFIYMLISLGNKTKSDSDASLIAGRWIHKPSNGTQNIELDPKQRKDFSQKKQSWFVDYLLRYKTNGFFVECGAGDGSKFSNSLYFELERKWTGLLIEPNKKTFQNLLSLKRKAFAINACLSSHNVSGLFNFSFRGLLSGLTDHQNVAEDILAASYKQELTRCFTLTSMLDAINVKHVDYLSLDVEGAEIDILKTIPFWNIYIDVIGVEYRVLQRDFNHPNVTESRKKLAALDGVLLGTGLYERVGVLPGGMDMTEEHLDNGLDAFYKRITK